MWANIVYNELLSLSSASLSSSFFISQRSTNPPLIYTYAFVDTFISEKKKKKPNLETNNFFILCLMFVETYAITMVPNLFCSRHTILCSEFLQHTRWEPLCYNMNCYVFFCLSSPKEDGSSTHSWYVLCLCVQDWVDLNHCLTQQMLEPLLLTLSHIWSSEASLGDRRIRHKDQIHGVSCWLERHHPVVTDLTQQGRIFTGTIMDF